MGSSGSGMWRIPSFVLRSLQFHLRGLAGSTRRLRTTASAARGRVCPSGAICRLLWRASAALALVCNSSAVCA
eukprot:6458644-Amphidinium_carterae.1